MKLKRRIALLLALVLLLCALSGCRKKEDPYEGIPNPIATITLSNGSQMQFELYLREAPNTVANFVELANSGFYDGQKFFRVVPTGFMQAGSPNNRLSGRADYVIQGEFAANGIENNVKHLYGTISMCRQSGYDTASSQFFIMLGVHPEYNGQYAGFGKILDDGSLQVLEAAAYTNVDGNNKPVDAVPDIVTIRVETYGYEYEAAKMPLPKVTARPAEEEEEL